MTNREILVFLLRRYGGNSILICNQPVNEKLFLIQIETRAFGIGVRVRHNESGIVNCYPIEYMNDLAQAEYIKAAIRGYVDKEPKLLVELL